MPKKAVFRYRPPKTDFTFLIYTPKNMYLKKTLFIANVLEKFPDLCSDAPIEGPNMGGGREGGW